jgi:hypothetical protein
VDHEESVHERPRAGDGRGETPSSAGAGGSGQAGDEFWSGKSASVDEEETSLTLSSACRLDHVIPRSGHLLRQVAEDIGVACERDLVLGQRAGLVGGQDLSRPQKGIAVLSFAFLKSH